MKKLLALFALLAIFASPVWATTKIVTIAVPGMSCAACPITVKKALTMVDGVLKADVSLEKRAATVTFDDARTNSQALIQATTDAGYPSQLVK
ncbi:mercury transporter [Sulfuricella sp. T08]|uniref:mercury resistance system periplasmic binding protein MerP n=1 Tax=Sulfuricella sp. T08 TaxID=1632857 RepID=UPI00061796E5|nr:mercury resistance system periplasmic binding protein MerP [Sulfuricella sp. T08]GAO35594.1 mercury transporter [Sulfuricella sp. T08]